MGNQSINHTINHTFLKRMGKVERRNVVPRTTKYGILNENSIPNWVQLSKKIVLDDPGLPLIEHH